MKPRSMYWPDRRYIAVTWGAWDTREGAGLTAEATLSLWVQHVLEKVPRLLISPIPKA